MKVQTSFFILVLGMVYSTLQAQNQYVVQLRDKQLNSHSLNSPQTFLAAKSIARREKQGILLNETDLPVSQFYLQQLSALNVQFRAVSKWLNTLVIECNEETAVLIAAKPFVLRVQKIHQHEQRSYNDKYEATAPGYQYYAYDSIYGYAYRQINMMNGDLLHAAGFRGQGMLIATMDNGWYNTNNISAFDSVRDQILYTYDFVHDTSNVYDDGVHGTNTFSCMAANKPHVMLGTAPDASYLLLETEDFEHETIAEEYHWAEAAEVADSIGADVLSTSLGYTTFDDTSTNHTYAMLDGHSTPITIASNLAASKGMVVINSAGNEGNQTWYHLSAPADGDSVLAIGAVDSFEVIAKFSSRGFGDGRIKPDLCAMGVSNGIISADGSWGRGGGTSFSCPTLAGLVACLWQAFPQLTSWQIREAVRVSANRYETPDTVYGYGIPNFYNTLLMLSHDTVTFQDQLSTLVFPNPFHDFPSLLLHAQESATYQFEIFDGNGSKVFDTSFFIRPNTFDYLPLTVFRQLSSGIYYLRVNGDKKHSLKLLKH